MNLKINIRCVGQVLLQIQLVPQSGYFLWKIYLDTSDGTLLLSMVEFGLIQNEEWRGNLWRLG